MTYPEKLNQRPVILASGSPRRQFLLRDLGLDFEVMVSEVEEIIPEKVTNEEVAVYLAELKAGSFDFETFRPGTILIAADTIVCLDHYIIGKPKDKEDAVRMLQMLSGRRHEVITGVCIKSADKMKTFFASSHVYFKELSEGEIRYYVDTFSPLDKAGAYGIQEWIGYVAIERIEGSFYNVMGLPVKRLYEELVSF